MTSDLIVIPARYGSTRLPGKPLASLAGVPLLVRVVRAARAAIAATGGIELVVATDDQRVAALARAEGAEVILSDAAIANGSMRALDAALRQAERPGRVVNLQGDAAFVTPAVLTALFTHMRRSNGDVLTPVIRLDWPALDRLRARKRDVPFSGTTCIRADDGRALWFSKTVLPAIRDETALRRASPLSPLSPVWQHVGLYGYTLSALERFAALPASRYERLEGLEQLRMLEAGMTIDTVEVEWGPWSVSGIDSPQDIVRAEREITAFGDPLDHP